MKMTRVWAMPDAKTFEIPVIHNFVIKETGLGKVSADPFCGGKCWATYNNDINPNLPAQQHIDASEFLESLVDLNIKLDVLILDPPYSPRQMSECYQSREGMQATQNASLMRQCRDAGAKLLKVGGIALSFGWNSNGMGQKRGFEIEEIILVAHGGSHNDTICLKERKIKEQMDLFPHESLQPLPAVQ